MPVGNETMRFIQAVLCDSTRSSPATRHRGPIMRLRQLFPAKRVVVIFPPDRASKRLAQLASATLHLGRGVLAQAQLPDSVIKPDGFALQRPANWK